MKRRLFALLAVCLIGLGALGDRLFNSGSSTAPAAAATSSSSTASSSSAGSAISASAIDRAIIGAYTTANKSVVYISNTGVGSGSGIIYDTAGDIVTNNHVIEGATSLSVTLNNGKTYTAHVVGTDKADDLAVIRIQAPSLTPAHFAAAGGYSVGQTVLAIGSPLGLKQSVTSGLISGLGRVEQEQNGAYLPAAIQTSAPINPGNSGGALVTLAGTVVGMPTLVQTSSSSGTTTQNIGFAIPSEHIVAITDQIIAQGKVLHTGRAYLGISPSDPSGQSASPFGFGGGDGSTSTVPGAVVSTLSPAGPAAVAGVQQGDVITQVDGTSITNASDLLTVLAQKKPGDTVTLTLNRSGTTTTVTVHLGEMPA